MKYQSSINKSNSQKRDALLSFTNSYNSYYVNITIGQNSMLIEFSIKQNFVIIIYRYLLYFLLWFEIELS